MTRRVKLILAGLFAAFIAVLAINARYLFVAPIPNTWIWWPGDETWLLSEYKNFLQTGHYINPLAPGSVFAESSGLIFGSCYLTAFLYAFPLLILHGHSIAVGRVITFVLSIATLFAMWRVSGIYKLPIVLRAFGLLLLSSSLCFFVTSHSARPDMIVGLTILLLAGCLPFMMARNSKTTDILLGFLLPASLLINGHVLIIAGPMIVYALWESGVLRNRSRFVRTSAATAAGFFILFAVQYLSLASWSISGPFTDMNSTMPFARFFHPRAQYTNYNWRYFIASEWAPQVMYLAIVLVAAAIWSKFHERISFSSMAPEARRFLVCAGLAVLSSIYIEYYWPRYFIYVLPTIILSFLIVISFLNEQLPHSATRVVNLALAVCLLVGLWRYANDALRMGSTGESITTRNEAVVNDALEVIHRRYRGRPHIFSMVPTQAVVMDDSCDLITPVTYDWPSKKFACRADAWRAAKVDYAIVYKDAEGHIGGASDSVTNWLANAHIIFERTGSFFDIDNPYKNKFLQNTDTLRVYEY